MGHKKPVRIDPQEAALPTGGADSHAHLDGAEFDADRDAVIARAAKVGVSSICNVFLGPEDYERKKDYFAHHPQVFYIMGIHPCDGLRCSPECLEKMSAFFQADSRLRAVGEIGLDFHWDDCPREIQMQAFSLQMEMAKNLKLPAVIHCREAESECLTLLEAGGFAGYPLLWHCFGGDAALARRVIRNGWHISVPGPVTYPANEALRAAMAEIPDDKLLLETDCPYLSPVPWRGTRNEPAYEVFTARAVATARNQDAATLWRQCGNNTRRFFGVTEVV